MIDPFYYELIQDSFRIDFLELQDKSPNIPDIWREPKKDHKKVKSKIGKLLNSSAMSLPALKAYNDGFDLEEVVYYWKESPHWTCLKELHVGDYVYRSENVYCERRKK